MTGTLDVLLDRDAVPIHRAVFTTLLDNSVAGTYADYGKALEAGRIPFATLHFLARKGEIPYPLFFADLELVKSQVAAKTQALLAGMGKDTFSIGSRAKVELRDVELIVKDLIRKQELLKRHDETLVRNRLVGLLRKPGPSAEADAARLMSTIGITHDMFRTCRTKAQALNMMIHRLESSQVLVSMSVQHHMPQRLTHVDFSGLTIRDAKVPYIFLAGGDHGDHQEPVGRTIFTLALMAVLVARRIFAPVTWNAESIETDLGHEYDIAGAMLMPATRLREISLCSLSDLRSAAAEFKVTPSAVTVRAARLGMVDRDAARGYLADLRDEYLMRPPQGGMNPIRPENAVRKYAGRELVRRMLDAVDTGSITANEFCRTVCLNVVRRQQLDDLRRAVK